MYASAAQSCVYLQHSLQTLGQCSHCLCLQSADVSRLFTVTTRPTDSLARAQDEIILDGLPCSQISPFPLLFLSPDLPFLSSVLPFLSSPLLVSVSGSVSECEWLMVVDELMMQSFEYFAVPVYQIFTCMRMIR